MNKFTGLIILDGYGLNKEGENNAISAKTSPYVLDLMKKYPILRIISNHRLSRSFLDFLPIIIIPNQIWKIR